jgi:hypothetical protein
MEGKTGPPGVRCVGHVEQPATRARGNGGYVTLNEMFTDENARTFEQRRDEVVSIVEGATDLLGADEVFRGIVERVRAAGSENEFNDAFEVLEWAMSEIPLSVH